MSCGRYCTMSENERRILFKLELPPLCFFHILDPDLTHAQRTDMLAKWQQILSACDECIDRCFGHIVLSIFPGESFEAGMRYLDEVLLLWASNTTRTENRHNDSCDAARGRYRGRHSSEWSLLLNAFCDVLKKGCNALSNAVVQELCPQYGCPFPKAWIF